MPVHDWTRVEAGIFHSFHVAWVPELSKALNAGLLPPTYYALAEQHFGRSIGDVLTLQDRPVGKQPSALPPDTGGIAVAEAPPKVSRKRTLESASLSRRRSIAIRHVSGHRLVALLEIVSPANKDRPRHVAEFAEKAADALEHGIHLLVIDLFPPGSHDPRGMSGAILEQLDDESEEVPPEEPLSLSAFNAGPPIDLYLEHVRAGKLLPQMPLFFCMERYVNVPLEATYQSAYQGMPAFWRGVLEGSANDKL